MHALDIGAADVPVATSASALDIGVAEELASKNQVMIITVITSSIIPIMVIPNIIIIIIVIITVIIGVFFS